MKKLLFLVPLLIFTSCNQGHSDVDNKDNQSNELILKNENESEKITVQSLDQLLHIKKEKLERMFNFVDFSKMNLESNYTLDLGSYSSRFIKLDSVCYYEYNKENHIMFTKDKVYEIETIFNKHYLAGSGTDCNNDVETEPEVRINVYDKPSKSNLKELIIASEESVIDSNSPSVNANYKSGGTVKLYKDQFIIISKKDEDYPESASKLIQLNFNAKNLNELFTNNSVEIPYTTTDFKTAIAFSTFKVSRITYFKAPFLGWASTHASANIDESIETDIELREFIEKENLIDNSNKIE